MPVSTKKHPEGLRPYFFHRLNLTYGESGNAQGTCPFCGKEDKFFVSQQEGLYDCKVCGERGNPYTFLRKLTSDATFLAEDLTLVAEERGISASVLTEWGLCQSPIDGEWMLPAYGTKEEVNNIYRWSFVGDKRRMLSSPEMPVCLFGLNLWDDEKPNVVICEGPWDGMKVYEQLSRYRLEGTKLIRTVNRDISLLASHNVVAVPGCETFPVKWASLFAGKNVTIIYDNDWERENPKTGKLIAPGGLKGMQRVSKELGRTPASLKAIRWGEEWWTKDLPSGYDSRDFLKDHTILQLLDKCEEVPQDWLKGAKSSSGSNGTKVAVATSDMVECTSYNELVQQWSKAMNWTDALDVTLSTVLAMGASTRLQEDQIWIRLIGVAGTAKSTVCEALAKNLEHTFPLSTLTGLHSGYVMDDSEKDTSLIPRMNNKILIINEGDMLLKAPNRDQIMAELRDLYTGIARCHYRNGKEATYTGLRTPVLLAGTPAIRALNKSALGDRFLDCIVYEKQSDLDERELVRSVLDETLDGMLIESGSDVSVPESKEKLLAQQMTGGYLKYLRENVGATLGSLEWRQKIPASLTEDCEALGLLVATMRTRQGLGEEDETEKELHIRLSKQLRKLAITTAFTIQTDINSEVMRRVAKVAKDTCFGVTFNLCKTILKYGPQDVQGLSVRMMQEEKRVRAAVSTLHSIGGLKAKTLGKGSGAIGKGRVVYTIADHLQFSLDRLFALT